MESGERSFEADVVVRAELLVAEGEAAGFRGETGGERGVSGRVAQRARAGVGLCGELGPVGELHIRRERAGAGKAGAVSCAGVGGSGRGEIEEIGVAGEGAGVAAGVARVDHMGVGLPFTLRMAGAEDAVDLVEVGVRKGDSGNDGGLNDESVEGLLVLPPTDVADETSVVQDEALATERHGGFLRGVGEEDLVDLVCFGIGDHCSAGGGGVEAGLTVTVALGGDDVLGFHQGFEAVPPGRGEAEAGAQREGFGVAERGLLHALVTEPSVEG